MPVSSRSLILVAGLPGAGKTELLRTLHRAHGVRIADPEQLRAAMLRRLPRRARYGLVRPLVHTIHRARIVGLSIGPSPTVVVHLPATSAPLRRAVTTLARLSRRTAHLVWLDVPAADARSGQRTRGRMLTARSFGRYVPRAERTSAQLAAGQLEEGWTTTLRLDRHSAQQGLHIATTAPDQTDSAKPRAGRRAA